MRIVRLPSGCAAAMAAVLAGENGQRRYRSRRPALLQVLLVLQLVPPPLPYNSAGTADDWGWRLARALQSARVRRSVGAARRAGARWEAATGVWEQGTDP